MRNQDLKDEMRIAGVRQWEVAEAIGVSEMTLVKWMRFELPEDKRQRVLQAIEQIKKSKRD